MKSKLLGLTLLILSITVYGQHKKKLPIFFTEPVIADSSSTVMIPVKYNSGTYLSGEPFWWTEYYSNIYFYNFKEDSVKTLFKEDTFIKSFTNDYELFDRKVGANRKGNISKKWIFYFVKQANLNQNSIEARYAPTVVFVSDKHGNGLMSVTPKDENAISLDIFDNQGFALIKMQRDSKKKHNFTVKNKDFYFIRVDLNTLTTGYIVEIRK